MIHKTSSSLSGHVRVVFELPASLWADCVAVVGEFNGWNATSHPLQQQRDGAWRTQIDLPAGNHYRYRYWIDGRWQADCHRERHTPPPSASLDSVVSTICE